VGPDTSPELVRKGLEFVVRERQRFASEGNQKLLARYLQLEDYYRSRIGPPAGQQ